MPQVIETPRNVAVEIVHSDGSVTYYVRRGRAPNSLTQLRAAQARIARIYPSARYIYVNATNEEETK
jgi:hypothetical protein